MLSKWKRGSFAVSLLAVLLLIASSATLWAQGFDGTLRGTVKDASAAVIANASVTATNDATKSLRTVETTSDGTFNFPNLQVGSYTVTVEVKGFKKYVRKGVEVKANQVVEVSAALEVGSLETVVEVAAGAELVQTTSSQVGGSVSERAVIDLPNPSLGGSPLNLSIIFPNTTTESGGMAGEGGSIGGTRPRNNNFTIDGVDNNDVSITGHLSPVIQDAVAEFVLLTNQFSAEYGHSSGGQFNIITKSGSNELHGDAHYYIQNKKMNAFDNLSKAAIPDRVAAGLPAKPRFDFNRIGGTLGGPIIKNKLFVFGAYEYQTRGREASGVSILAPTASGLSTLNSLAVNSAVRTILAQVPTAGSATDSIVVNGQTIPIGTLQLFAPDFFAQHDFQINVDLNTARHQYRGRFLYDRFRAPNINPEGPLSQFSGSQFADNRKILFTDIWAINNRVVNDFRTSYSRNVNGFGVPDEFKNFPNAIVADLGLNLGPEGNSPQGGTQNIYQILDNISYTRGRHQLKFGVEYRNWIAPSDFLPRARGEWGYQNFSQLINDQIPTGLNGALRGAGSGFFAGNQNAIYWFAQDDFKVSSRLTFNLGLRYEYASNPRDASLQALNSIASVPGLFDFRVPKTDRNNFAPRFGFAFDPKGDGKMAIRGGFGVSYDVTFQNLVLLQLPPQLQTEQNPNLTCALSNPPAWCPNGPGFLAGGGLLAINVPPTTAADARTATQSLIVDTVAPKILTWSLSVQRQFGKDWEVEVRYLGTRADHLPIQVQLNSIQVFDIDPNLALPTFFSASQVPSKFSLSAPTQQDIFDAENLRFAAQGFDGGFVTAFPGVGNSIYHGGSIDVNRRFGQGFFLKANYTWSHVIDDSTNELFTSRVNPRRPQNPYNLRDERGNSALDKPHKFTFAWTYDLPKARVDNAFAKKVLHGWQINGTYLAESGQPVTALSGIDANGNFDSAGDRALLNPNGIGLTGTGVSYILRNPTTGTTSLCNPATSDCDSTRTVGYVANNPTARFVVAETGTKAAGTVGRNTIRTPGLNNWNISLFKNTNISEKKYIQFQLQMLNAFNHRQPSLSGGSVFGFLDNALSTTYSNVSSSNFLNSGQFNGGGRTIQLALKLVF